MEEQLKGIEAEWPYCLVVREPCSRRFHPVTTISLREKERHREREWYDESSSLLTLVRWIWFILSRFHPLKLKKKNPIVNFGTHLLSSIDFANAFHFSNIYNIFCFTITRIYRIFCNTLEKLVLHVFFIIFFFHFISIYIRIYYLICIYEIGDSGNKRKILLGIIFLWEKNILT